MSFVYDLRATLGFAFVGGSMLAVGLFDLARGEPAESWLVSVAGGTVVCALLLDGVQRRWRGDPRARERGHDVRSLAATTVCFAGLALVGLWSLSQGHRALTWGGLLLVGVGGAATSAWQRRSLGA